MIQLGKINTLTILRDTPVGMYLSDGKQDILLPKKYILPEFNVNDNVDVFVYTDSEDRPIATTLTPYAFVNQFAYLKVVGLSAVGAFLDWGLEKDLFVPFKEQSNKMEEGESYVVFIYLDELSQRIVASNKINKFISNHNLTVEQGEEVDLLIYSKTNLGFSCIINDMHKGLIYHNDVFTDLKIGTTIKGYVKLIRTDGLIDVSLQKIGFKNVLSSTEKIEAYLIKHNGYLALTDKSSPEEIQQQFDMSKATFKKSIGVLYRQRKVILKDDGVYLVQEGDSTKNS